MTIANFLLARIEEDEAVALAAIDDDCGSTEGFAGQYERLVQPPSGVGYARGGFGGPAARMIVTYAVPARVLAECAAKRAVVAMQAANDEDRHMPGFHYKAQMIEGVLRTLAAVYSAHPDYRPGWAVQ